MLPICRELEIDQGGVSETLRTIAVVVYLVSLHIRLCRDYLPLALCGAPFSLCCSVETVVHPKLRIAN